MRNCKICGNDISHKNKQARFCQSKCRRKYYNNLQETKEKRNKQMRDRYKNDLLFRIKHLYRVNLRDVFRYEYKNIKPSEVLGCSYEFFKEYLESKFEPWMSWDNKGKYNGEFNFGWDIDHIIPISSAKSIDDMIKLNHYTNLQPLCSKINRDIKKNIF